MKRWFLPAIYAILLIANIVAIENDYLRLAQITKSLLMPVLILYFIRLADKDRSILNKWVVIALLFSWIGDVLLLFQQSNEKYFLAGLAAFLLAHVCYIIYFHNIRMIERINPRWIFLVIVVIYYAAFISWLNPFLGDKKIPVRIYGLAISFMLLLALHMGYLKPRVNGIFMIAGAILFVLSDSILAVDKFYNHLPGAGWIIMGSYGLAQFLIAEGAARYSRYSE